MNAITLNPFVLIGICWICFLMGVGVMCLMSMAKKGDEDDQCVFCGDDLSPQAAEHQRRRVDASVGDAGVGHRAA